MKNLKLTTPVAITLFLTGYIITIASSIVGKTIQVNPDIYTIWDALNVSGIFISIWILGYWTRSSQDS